MNENTRIMEIERDTELRGVKVIVQGKFIDAPTLWELADLQSYHHLLARRYCRRNGLWRKYWYHAVWHEYWETKLRGSEL